MKKWHIIGVIGLCAAGTALAQELEFDKDGDGALSLEEFQAAQSARAAERFAALDANHDGKVTVDEMRARGRPMAGQRRDRSAAIDTDGDGAWSLAELQTARPEFTLEQFQKLDKNGDGLITADERPLFGRGGAHGPHGGQWRSGRGATDRG